MFSKLTLKAASLAGLVLCAGAVFGAASLVSTTALVTGRGGRLAYNRGNNTLLADIAGTNGFRDIYRFSLDGNGNVTGSSVCLTCGNPDFPYHTGNARMDPFGRGFMFQAMNKTCPATTRGTDPGSGICNDWWWYAFGNNQFYPVSAPLPAYDGKYGQMHGRWSKNADFFMFGYKLNQPCTDTFGCNSGSWELHAVEITWTNPAPNVYVPQFGTVHVYSPGVYPGHFYQMTGTSPMDNGLVLFESTSLYRVQADGDADVAIMRVQNSDGTWLNNDQANASLVILSEFSTDGSHTVDWNELANFTPDGLQVQWMSDHDNPKGTSLANIYTDYWRCNPDGSNKTRLTYFNNPSYPEYDGSRTISSFFAFAGFNPNRFYSYIYRNNQDNIYRIDVPLPSSAIYTLNAATFVQGVAPGALASAFATLNGVPSTVASALPWPTTLANVQVTVNGVPAPLYYVGPTQVNFQVPQNTPVGTATINILVNNTSVAQASATVSAVSPGIFVLDQGSLLGAIRNQDNAVNGSGTPTRRGDVIQIYGTGAGPLQTPVADGFAPSPYSLTQYQPKIYFGNVEGRVLFSGVAGFPGFWQVNAAIPPNVSGLVPIVVVQNGVQSNQVTVWVNPQ